MLPYNDFYGELQNRFLNFTILKNDFISNKNYGWRDKLKKRRRLLINGTHATS